MTRQFFVEVILVRVVSVAITIAMAMSLSPILMGLCVIVLGQGHFLMAYWYQAEGGHLGPRKLALLSGGLATVLWCSLLLPFPVFNFLVGVGFLVHFVIDEGRLINKKHSLYTTLEALPFLIIYISMIAEVYLNAHVFLYAVGASVVILAYYAYLSLKNKRAPNGTSYSFLCWLLLSVSLYSIDKLVSPNYSVKWFWGLILLHYLIWYGVYWFKLADKLPARNEYILRAVVLNIALILLAGLWVLRLIPVMDLVFGLIAFNVWTTMHGLSSLRPQEFVDSFKLP